LENRGAVAHWRLTDFPEFFERTEPNRARGYSPSGDKRPEPRSKPQSNQNEIDQGDQGGADAGGARYQVVAGFRRLAAVRLLARGRVLARVHGELDDEDAWSLALADALLGAPLSLTELGALRDRLTGLGTASWAEELVDEAQERALEAPPPAGEPDAAAQDAASAAAAAAEEGPEEVTPDQLAEAVASGLWSVGQDLDLAVDSWLDLPEHGRRQIVEQLRYLAELHAFLAGARR
jgi:hypothetical protein